MEEYEVSVTLRIDGEIAKEYSTYISREDYEKIVHISMGDNEWLMRSFLS